MDEGNRPVAVKRVRRRSVSVSRAKKGRPPFVALNDRRGNKWRIYFRLPTSIKAVPGQLIVTSVGDTHTLEADGPNGKKISVPVVAAIVVEDDPVLALTDPL